MHKTSLLKLAWARAKAILYLLKRGKFKLAYNYIWVSLFTRDSGASLLDPLYRRFPWLVRYPETI